MNDRTPHPDLDEQLVRELDSAAKVPPMPSSMPAIPEHGRSTSQFSSSSVSPMLERTSYS